MPDPIPGIAFFDVDETLITVKSMFRFLEYYFRALGSPPERYSQAYAALAQLVASGMSRAEANLKYYEFYAGHQAEDVAAIGRSWFAEEMRGGSLFYADTVRALAEHRNAGELTVLVSGSFSACVEPVREHLAADVVLCTTLEAVDGVYTGNVVTPMIGDAKAAAVRDLMADRSVPADRCHAYGDHSSDLPLLEAVGDPVVVGDDRVLLDHALRYGWRVLRVAEPRHTTVS